MAANNEWLGELQKMNAQKEKIGQRLGTLPTYDVPEPIEARVELPKEKTNNAHIDEDTDFDETDLGTQSTQSTQNTEGVHHEDTGASSATDTAYTPTDSQVQKLNEISAKEVVKNYSLFVNAISLEGFEWKNGETESGLVKQRDALRYHLKQERASLTQEEQLGIHNRIDEITQMFEKHKERKNYLDEASKISPEKQEAAARLLAEIWKVKNIEVSPWWGLVIIACAPLLNAAMIIFMDGKRLKLGGA